MISISISIEQGYKIKIFTLQWNNENFENAIEVSHGRTSCMAKKYVLTFSVSNLYQNIHN